MSGPSQSGDEGQIYGPGCRICGESDRRKFISKQYRDVGDPSYDFSVHCTNCRLYIYKADGRGDRGYSTAVMGFVKIDWFWGDTQLANKLYQDAREEARRLWQDPDAQVVLKKFREEVVAWGDWLILADWLGEHGYTLNEEAVRRDCGEGGIPKWFRQPKGVNRNDHGSDRPESGGGPVG